KTVLLEKGCVVNSLYSYPTNMVFFTTPELMEIGGIPMTSLGEKPTRTEALKYYVRVADFYKLDIRQYQNVESISGEDGAFVTHARDRARNAQTYRSAKVVLATGYYDRPNRLNVPGEELAKVLHYYRDPHPYYAQDVAVIGGNNSAAIAALELHWAGARVTLIHREAALSDHVKYWIKPNLENRIASGEVKACFRSQVREIRQESILLDTPGGPVSLQNDFVFAMIGYHPDVEFLAAHGIPLDPDTQRPRTDPATLESQRKGIYLAGVLVAGMHTNEIFIENGRFHGAKIAAAIGTHLGKPA
ncbi:MAG TPA: YpdA family putative bacillithiol disulfide reductase, partial [Bryobacteraceae bacterium]|nr:YpdA family putative bacillithiol disulfide reductase [Bryobacteraceae bacterium]